MATSTIRYSRDALAAAGHLGFGADDLASRRPHKKKGTGSSGTDHKRADGKAAVRVAEMVEDEIERRTGVRQRPADFL
ncbi:unnamed protein product, partial [Phaeothamnion confervicola]